MERNPLRIKLGIGIPTLNRYDLLKQFLPLYERDFSLRDKETPFFILDNGNQGIDFQPSTIIIKEKNIGVGASWNQLCQNIFLTCDYALILNDDIYLGKNKEEIKLVIFKNNIKFVRATQDWCAFIIPKNIYEKVGMFDECFYPAYYEDMSYQYRMKLKAIPVIKTPLLNPRIYNSSKSLEKDQSILESSKKNKKLYVQMWGGEPEREKFKKPFNI
jgi:hypothetical protein